MNTNTIGARLADEISSSLKGLAQEYTLSNTSFEIGYPEGGDKLHILLVDIHTKTIIKKINCARFLLKNKSEALLGIFRSALESEVV